MQVSQENPCVGVSLNKVAGLQDLLKRDSNTYFFLWNMWNFKVHPEHSGGCFWQCEKCICSTSFYPATKGHGSQSNFEKFFAAKRCAVNEFGN